MPSSLKKSINQAHSENGTFKQIVSHLEKDLKLNGLEAPEVFYGSYAYKYIFDCRPFPFVAARQLMELPCSKFD